MDKYKFVLCGNPNVGKTSLYNRLTHSFNHVGNWHGVTVSSDEKAFDYNGNRITLIDLPGTYSLTATSDEEAVTRDAIFSKDFDAVICVCEVNNLARNLYLAVQLIELGVKCILVVNMIDELEKRGQTLDEGLLSERMGIAVIKTSAKFGKDERIIDAAIAASKGEPSRLPDYVSTLSGKVATNVCAFNLKQEFVKIKLLEGDPYFKTACGINVNSNHDEVSGARYAFIEKITSNIITQKSLSVKKPFNIDKVLLNKYTALPTFLLLMGLIITLTFGVVGKYLSDGLVAGINAFIYQPAKNALIVSAAPTWVVGLITEGIISGIGGVLAFLPQIILLFLFLSLLEDSGYISRVAFMTDEFFKKIGLSGRAVFTMLMGLGCSASACFTARALDKRMRLRTVLVTPFLPCGARLPIFAVICSAYFNLSAIVIIGLYILGALVAVAWAAILNKADKSEKDTSFVMEIPPYRLPTFERVFQLIWHNVKSFLVRVGTVIFALSVIVWLLSNFSVTGGFESGVSLMEMFASFIAPIFKPLGFGSWQAVAALISGVVAKETVISTIVGFGGANLIFTTSVVKAGALAFVVFTLLYVPCVATLAAIAREVGVKYVFVSLLIHTVTAYVFALIAYYAVILFTFHLTAGLISIACVIALIALAIVAKFALRRMRTKAQLSKRVSTH